jgi:hypothetical protein
MSFTLNPEIIQHGRAGNVTTEVDYLPTPGVRTIYVVCPVTMGHATIVTLTLATADDAAGTNTTALTANVPVFVNGVRAAADAKAGSVPAANYTNGILSNFIVFEVPANLVPEDKYLGIACNAGSASNTYSAFAFEDVYYQ